MRRGTLVRTLAAWLEQQPRPQAVVSVFPNFNGVLRDALGAVHPGVPLVVVLTDLADFPPRFWIEPGISRVVVGTPEAAEQARTIGIPDARVSQVSGMILHPRFYRTDGAELRERVRAELGARSSDFTVTLLFGGKGSPEIGPLAERLIEQDGLRVMPSAEQPGAPDSLAPLDAISGGRLNVSASPTASRAARRERPLLTKPGPGSLSGLPAAAVVVTRDIHDSAGAFQHRVRGAPAWGSWSTAGADPRAVARLSRGRCGFRRCAQPSQG